MRETAGRGLATPTRAGARHLAKRTDELGDPFAESSGRPDRSGLRAVLELESAAQL